MMRGGLTLITNNIDEVHLLGNSCEYMQASYDNFNNIKEFIGDKYEIIAYDKTACYPSDILAYLIDMDENTRIEIRIGDIIIKSDSSMILISTANIICESPNAKIIPVMYEL